ncbi:MAG: hypothetical protein WDN44_08365 [Sphingomonas sp.]
MEAELLDLPGQRSHLCLERGDALGEIGDRAGRGRAGHVGRGRLGGDLRLKGLAGAAGEDLALHRAHFVLEPIDPAFERRRLRMRRSAHAQRSHRHRGRHQDTHYHTPGCIDPAHL